MVFIIVILVIPLVISYIVNLRLTQALKRSDLYTMLSLAVATTESNREKVTRKFIDSLGWGLSHREYPRALKDICFAVGLLYSEGEDGLIDDERKEELIHRIIEKIDAQDRLLRKRIKNASERDYL